MPAYQQRHTGAFTTDENHVPSSASGCIHQDWPHNCTISGKWENYSDWIKMQILGRDTGINQASYSPTRNGQAATHQQLMVLEARILFINN